MRWTKLTPEERAAIRAKLKPTVIEDRRGDEPVVQPTPEGSLVRGLPQTPHEFELYKQRLIREQAIRMGQPMPPVSQPMVPGLGDPPTQAGPGDPAGLESRRAAIQARIAQDQAALAEVNTRLGALQKVKAPKR